MNVMNRKVNALVLIAINLMIPLTAMFSYNFYLSYYLFGFSGLLMIYYGRKRRFLKFLAAYLFFGIGYHYSLKIPLTNTNAVSMTFFIFFHFLPLMMIGSLLFYDYNASEMLSSLQLLKLNRKFMIALTITLRYLPTFQSEFKIMKASMAMRGIDFTWKHPIRSFAFFITPQLFRSSLLAEELTAAGITKGIEHPSARTSILETKWTAKDSLILFLFFIGIIAVLLLGGKK